MQVVTAVQIGDIHYPDIREQTIADLKDDALPKNLLASLAPKKLQKVFERIATNVQENANCGILICGDLTSRGDIGAYRDCVKHLARLLGLSDLENCRWHVVPGNHDVDRHDLDPGQSPYPALFTPLQDVWSELVAARPLPIDNYRMSSLPKSEFGIAIYSLNSCVACGEWRRFSEKMLGTLTKQVRAMVDAEDDAGKKFNLLSEQLDSPLVSDSHLTDLRMHLAELNPNIVPIVLAHHNVLPQATPRADIYTEMLNAGAIRSRFTALNRIVVYCHGHIHDDPIEIIRSPRSPSSQLISISAPEIEKGFNQLTFHYSDSWIPLGLEVSMYRLQPHGDIDIRPNIRIPFVTPSMLCHVNDPILMQIASLCRPTYQTSKVIRDALDGPKPQFASLAEKLKELEWYGVVEIQNRDTRDDRDLRIRRVLP